MREQLQKKEIMSHEEMMGIIVKLEEENKELKRQKRYGLVWEEQLEEVEKQLQNNYPVLKEVKKREIVTDKEKPMNLLIEGDNLHSLQSLLYTHREKVSVVEIDCPYNTGNKDFIYNDRYIDKEDTWRHSKWLSFMAKRLRLAKELMTEDGVIFIHIDDNEQAQLKLLCDDIFGEDNFVTNFIWKSRSSLQYSEPLVSSQSEYILLYSKNKKIWNVKTKKFNRIIKSYDNGNYKNPDGDINGPWLSSGIIRDDGRKKYKVISPNGTTHTEAWLYSEDNFNQLINEGKIWWGKNDDAKPRKKSYLKDFEGNVSSNLLIDEFLMTETSESIRKKKIFTIGTTESGTKSLLEILGYSLFDYPKPESLLKYLINLYPDKNAIILDFFAGSGTAGHAVMELNKEDGGNRQFILCTNNENNICEDVTYERLKRVINGYTTPKGKEVDGLGGNLKYYKTDMVSKSQDINDVKYELLDKSLDLLSIKENAFELVRDTDEFKIFRGQKNVMGVYLEYYPDYAVLDVIKEAMLNESVETMLLYVPEGLDINNDEKIDELKRSGIDIKKIPSKIMEILEGK